MAKERWKRIKGEKGYLISSWGRIFSLKTETLLRPYLHKSRANVYLRVSIGSSKYFVHVLVLLMFKNKEWNEMLIKFPNEIIQVGHKDRNTLNPNLNNLQWETENQNKAHRYETDIIDFGGKTYKGRMS